MPITAGNDVAAAGPSVLLLSLCALLSVGGCCESFDVLDVQYFNFFCVCLQLLLLPLPLLFMDSMILNADTAVV